jgi:hypothetical protein
MKGRINHNQTAQERLADEARRLKLEAENLPFGKERDELIRKSRQAVTASLLNDWLSSSGLKPPN